MVSRNNEYYWDSVYYNTVNKSSSPISKANFSMKPWVINLKLEGFLPTYSTWFIFILTFSLLNVKLE